MKKVGIITFHASHNYGSMLQAYALQQVVLSLGHECEIINFRTDIQKKIYSPFFMYKGWLKKLKAIRYPRLAIDDIRKYRKFEKFLRQQYILSSKTYSTAEELKLADLDYNCYISGSDQIWNTTSGDFNFAYFLDFVRKGKRIAYAASMGPAPSMHLSLKKSLFPYIREYVSKYDSVFVREKDTAAMLEDIVGIKPEIVLDPTLLLNPQDWSALAGDKPLVSGDYILAYTPRYDDYKQLFVDAMKIAERHNLKVICTIPDNISRWRRNPRFEYYTATGPIEFLNLVKYSKYVFCKSFHAVVFSIIFCKPFFAYEGMMDSRISPLLKIAGLEYCADTPNKQLFIYDSDEVWIKFESDIHRSIQLLKNAING